MRNPSVPKPITESLRSCLTNYGYLCFQNHQGSVRARERFVNLVADLPRGIEPFMRHSVFHQVKPFRRGHMRDQTGLETCVPEATGGAAHPRLDKDGKINQRVVWSLSS